MNKSQKAIINNLLGLVAPAMLAFGLSLLPMLAPVASATAGINNSLNYQGRLLTSSGAIAPDGFYNIEFKIYQDGTGCVTSGSSPCGGTLKYTEDWVYGTGSPDNRVKVTNGYFSVQIGTINTTLASSVDWNQNTLWMSVNIGNTSTAANFAGASGDGEMLPFKRLTAAPYALNAAALGGLASSAFVQLSANNNFTGTNNITTTTNSTTAFEVQPAGGGTPVLDVDTTNSRVGIGIAAPIYTLDVRGGNGINSAAGYSVNGTAGATLTCASGQIVSGAATSGGIATAGVCSDNKIGINSMIQGTGSSSSVDPPLAIGASGNATFSLFNGSIVKQVACGNYACNVSSVVTPAQPGHVGATAHSMTLAADGTPRYTYYDNSGTGALVFTQCNDAACSTGTNTTVDSSANVGVYSSVVMGSDGFARIAYVDTTNSNVKFVQCTNVTCSGNVINVIGAGGGPVSLKLDSSNFARIAYSGAGALKYAYCSNVTCGTGNVTSVTIDANGNSSYGSLALTSGGLPRFAYYGVSGGFFRAKYAYCAASTCATPLTSVVDSTVQDSSGAAIAIGGDGFPRIAYNDTTNNDLRYAQCYSDACSGTGITNHIIDYVGVLSRANIAVGSDGLARIAYYNGTLNSYKFWVEAVNDNSLSSLTAASATNSLDNLSYAQNWSWSTATTQTAMTMNANALTSGGLLAASSSSTALTGAVAAITASGSNAAVTGSALQVSMTGVLSAGTALNVSQAGTGVGLKVNQTGSAGNALQVGTAANANALTVNHAGGVGIGIASAGASYALDVVGAINSSTGYYYGGLAGSSPTCTNGQFLQNQAVGGGITTGGTCVSLATISNGFFTQTGSTIAGITCTNGQTLVWNSGTWGCGTGSSGSAGSTSVSSIIDTSDSTNGYWPSQIVDNQGLSHVVYGDSTNSALKHAVCVTSGCGSATITTLTPSAVCRSVDAFQGSDTFGRVLEACGSTYRFLTCYDAPCTSNHSTVIAASVGSGHMLKGSDGYARIVVGDSGGVKFIRCTNEFCTSPTSNYVSTADSTYGSYATGSSALVAMGIASSDNTPRIVYQVPLGAGLNRMRYAQCANADCSTITSVTSPVTSNYSYYGSYSGLSMAMGSNGLGRIVYDGYNGSNPALLSVRCTAEDCSTATTGIVYTATATNILPYNPVIRYSSVGSFTAVTFDFYGTVNISLYYVLCSGDPCNNNAITTTILSSGNYPGGSNSVVGTDAGGYLRISYQNTGGNTKPSVVSCTSSNCSSPAPYTLDANSPNNTSAGTAIYLDGSYFPHVFAQEGYGSTPASSNHYACGTTTCSAVTLYVVDASLSPNGSNANYFSIAMGNDNLPRIAAIYNESAINGGSAIKFIECLNNSCNSYNFSTIYNTSGALYIGQKSFKVDSSGFYRLLSSDGTNGVFYLKCSNAVCSSNTVTTISSSAGSVTNSLSMALTSGGLPLLAYSNGSGLKYVNCSTDTCASPTPLTLDSATNVGDYASLVLNNSGLPAISYYDALNLDLKFVACSSTACSSPAPLTVDSTGSVGFYTSIAIGADGFPRISYYDATNTQFKIASCNNSGCTSNSFIGIPASSGAYSALAVDSSGYMRVAYRDVNQLRFWAQVPAGGAITPILSALTAAIADNTINNGAFAQTWQWSSLTNQANPGFSMNANSLTSGVLAYDSSSSNNLSGSILKVESTGTGSGVTGSGLTVAMSGTGNAGTALSISQGSIIGNGLSVATSAATGTNSSTNLVITGNGRLGIGAAPNYLIDVQGGDINIGSTYGLRIGGTGSGGSYTCDSTGCNDRLTFNGAGLFTRTGNTVTTGISCSNGQTLSYNQGTAMWTCASGVFVSNSSSIYGAASSTSVYATTTNYFSSQTIDSQGLSHISFGNVVSGLTSTIKNVQCLSTGCGNSIVNTPMTTCSYQIIDSAVGSDNFGRILFTCGDNILRLMVCGNATCTSNYVSIIDTSFNNSNTPNASLVLDSSNYARIAEATNNNSLRYIQCANNACTASTTANLDGTASNYYYPSIANESDDGLPRIAYETYNGTNYSIKYLECNNAACTSTASITSIATGLTSMSNFVSLAMSTVSGNNLHGRVIYVGASTVMQFVKCTTDNCSGFSTTALSTMATASYLNGRMRIGSDGNARIVWDYWSGSYWYLAYTSCSADPCSTTSYSNLAGASNVYHNPSMVLGTDGFPRIVFIPDGPSTPWVSYMQCTSVACGTHPTVSINGSGYGSGGAMYLGNDGFARILYYYSNPSSTSTLEYVTCTTVTCSSGNTSYNIDGVNTNNPNMNSYSQSAMAIGGDGYPVFAEIYNNNNNGGSTTNSANFLKISKCLNSTCSYYQYSSIAMAYNVSAYISPTSLKIGSDGFPRLVYSTNSTGSLYYLACGDVYCSTSTTSTVAASGVTQLEVSLALTSGNIARISYMASGLVYAKCNDNACSSPTIKVVDNVNASTGRYNSLILGTDGFARISYQDASNYDLKFAQCNDDNCSVPVVSTLASLGSTGYYTSMALGSDGYPRIAYYDGSIGSLMVIKCSSSSCGTYTVTPIAPAGTYPSLLVDSNGYMRISYVNSSGAIALWLEATSGSGFVSLSGLGAAVGGNTIDNLNWAQSWNWSTASTQTDLSMASDALTSGSALSISTASTTGGGLTGNLVSFTASGNSAGVSGNVLALNMSGAASTGNALKLDKAGTAGFALLVNSGAVKIGSGSDYVAFDATTHKLSLNGASRQVRTINLPVEYAGAALLADGTNNNGSLTAPYDTGSFDNYYKWTTAQATNQDYDIVVKVPLPSDFGAWYDQSWTWQGSASAAPIRFRTYTSDTTNGTITATLRDTANALVTGWNSCSLTPGSATTWTTKDGCAVTTGTYAADGYLTLDLHLQSPLNGDVRTGAIVMRYYSNF